MESIASFVNHTTSSLHASQLLPSLPPPSSTTTVLLLSPLPTHKSPNHSPHLSPTTSPISSPHHFHFSIYHSFHPTFLPILEAQQQVLLDSMMVVTPRYLFLPLSPSDSNPNIHYHHQNTSPHLPPLHCHLPLSHHPQFCFPQCIVWNEGGLMEGRGREGT